MAFKIKYFPGEPCTFLYSNYYETTIAKKAIIVFEVVRPFHIMGTLKNISGELPFFEKFHGNVFIKKEYLSDSGFRNQENFKNLDDIHKDLPLKGFYIANQQTKLFLDVDKKGKVWLTRPTFFEQNLYRQLSNLNISMIEEKRRIKEKLWAIEIARGYRDMYKEAEMNDRNIPPPNTRKIQINDFIMGAEVFLQ